MDNYTKRENKAIFLQRYSTFLELNDDSVLVQKYQSPQIWLALFFYIVQKYFSRIIIGFLVIEEISYYFHLALPHIINIAVSIIIVPNLWAAVAKFLKPVVQPIYKTLLTSYLFIIDLIGNKILGRKIVY